jgi:hypothetical protein
MITLRNSSKLRLCCPANNVRCELRGMLSPSCYCYLCLRRTQLPPYLQCINHVAFMLLLFVSPSDATVLILTVYQAVSVMLLLLVSPSDATTPILTVYQPVTVMLLLFVSQPDATVPLFTVYQPYQPCHSHVMATCVSYPEPNRSSPILSL